MIKSACHDLIDSTCRTTGVIASLTEYFIG